MKNINIKLGIIDYKFGDPLKKIKIKFMEGEMGKVKRLYLAKCVGKEFCFKSRDRMEPIVFVLENLDDGVVFLKRTILSKEGEKVLKQEIPINKFLAMIGGGSIALKED